MNPDGEALTYSQILRAEREVHPALLQERLIDEALALMAGYLIRRGENEVAALLGRASSIVYEVDHDYDGSDDPGIYVEHEPEDEKDFERNADRLREVFNEVIRRKSLPLNWIMFRDVMPDVKYYGWRQYLSQEIDGKRPSNHARKVRAERPRFTADHLAFTNSGELAVYQALRNFQDSAPLDKTIGIFPLPAGRIRGHTWEPDVIITYKGRAGVLEIDGPHHNARRALDTTRDSLFEDAGIAYVQRIPVEVVASPKELNEFLRRFLRRLAER